MASTPLSHRGYSEIERSRNRNNRYFGYNGFNFCRVKGFLYILECSDGSYYCGSTVDLDKRLKEHNEGKGANHTKKRLPVKLMYVEEYDRIDKAFYREKQIQGWSRNKKEVLINGDLAKLNGLAECKNETHFKHYIEEKFKP